MKKNKVKSFLTSVLTFFVLCSVQVKTSLASDSKYVFDPVELNQMRAEATDWVDDSFRSLSEMELRLRASQYFNEPSLEAKDILVAYRTEMILMRLHQTLLEKYPDKILKNPTWVWNNVGGVYARFLVLYCSFKEYLGLWGSSIKQAGFSGVYPHIEFYDIVLSGEMKSNSAQSQKSLPKIYHAGDVSLLSRNESRFYSLDKFTYMIDYGRGRIAEGFWQGVLSPFFFANHDASSLKEQLKSCGGSIVNHLTRGGDRFSRSMTP
ncbi:MAG: hypothetical protein ACO3A2_10210 [Bdellovibrionia bacterium]